MRYHLAAVRIAIIKKARNNKCWWGSGEKGTLLHCWWECKLVQPLWEKVWRFPQKLRIELPHEPAIPLLRIYPKNTKTLTWKDIRVFKMTRIQGPTALHRELCSMLCGSLIGRGVWRRMDTCICMAELLCCAPETITTLLISYTPI